MKKIIVIGCPGSGKSTFSRTLAQRTGIPLHHLDLLYWNADKTTVPKELFRTRLQQILKEDEWIIDGNYGSTMEIRLQFCDTVIFLDLPVEVCLDGVRARVGKPRPDMPWIETEADAEFLHFIKAFSAESRPKILTLLANYPQKSIVVLHSRDEMDAWLQAL